MFRFKCVKLNPVVAEPMPSRKKLNLLSFDIPLARTNQKQLSLSTHHCYSATFVKVLGNKQGLKMMTTKKLNCCYFVVLCKLLEKTNKQIKQTNVIM